MVDSYDRVTVFGIYCVLINLFYFNYGNSLRDLLGSRLNQRLFSKLVKWKDIWSSFISAQYTCVHTWNRICGKTYRSFSSRHRSTNENDYKKCSWNCTNIRSFLRINRYQRNVGFYQWIIICIWKTWKVFYKGFPSIFPT